MRTGLALVGGALMAALAASAGAQTSLPPVSIPKPRAFVEMGYPAAALELQLQGTVVVRAMLDANGRVTSAEALSGSPSLSPDAVTNVRQWTFEPGPASAVIAYRFEIDYGRCNDETRGLFRLTHDNMVVLTTCKGPTRQVGVYGQSDPWIRERGEPVYPPIARSARVAGPVILALTLDRQGKVTSAEALSGPLLLSPSAIAHARTWRMSGYRRLPRQMVVVYEFGLDLRGCGTEETGRAFWQADSGHVHLDACPPLVQVSSQTRPKP